MRVAILGGSGHYPYALSGIRARAEQTCKEPLTLCAVAPGTPGESIASLLAACKALGLSPGVYEDWQALLDAEKPDIAAVNPWFCDSARICGECLRRGIHAYSEKPLATQWQALSELETAYGAGKADLGVMLDGQHTPWLRAVKRELDSGAIGAVRLLHGQKSYKMGMRKGVYEKVSRYGGMLQWIAIHPLSWFRYLLDGADPLWVSAQTDDRENGGFGEMESTGCILARYPLGVLATVDADFYRPVGAPRHDDDRVRVTGTCGMIEVVDGRIWLENDQPRREVAPEPPEEPFLFFTDAIGTPAARAQAQTGFALTRVSLQARDAANQAKPREINAQ